jgi:hypothetical protein
MERRTFGAGGVDLTPYLPKAGGTMTGAIVLPGNPGSALQAAPKQYVDAQALAASGTAEAYTDTALAAYLQKAGGTMTGAIVLPGNPGSALQAAPKQYVDSQATAASGTAQTYTDTALTAYLQKAGGTMTGAIVLPGNPSSALQAAPKQYVDLRQLTSEKGVASGYAGLDSNGRVPSTQAYLSPAAAFPLASGFWHQPGLSSSTNNGLGFGTSRAFPWFARTAITITGLAYEVSTAGDASAAMRMDVYSDDGTEVGGAGWFGAPGSTLLGSSGSVAGSTVAVQSSTSLSISVPAGWFWISGTLLGSGTQPTIRTIGTAPYLMTMPSTTPTSLNGSYLGYSGTGGSGAAPSSFGAATRSTALPRIAFKI